jgi:predicted peroxiredoxin
MEDVTVNCYMCRATEEGNQVNGKHIVDTDEILGVIKHAKLPRNFDYPSSLSTSSDR